MGLIRIILAFSVAINHFGDVYGFRMGPGSVEVEGFFAISGFYMFLVLHERYYQIGIWRFYATRYCRLIPSYLAILLVTILFAALTGVTHRFGMQFSDWVQYVKQADIPFSFYVIFSNLTIFLLDSALFLSFDGSHAKFTIHFMQSPVKVYEFLWIPQAWSLGVELIFYAFAPFILLTKRRMLIALLCSSSVILLVKVLGLPTDPFAHRFFPGILYLFVLGSLSCWWWERHDTKPWVKILGALGCIFVIIWMITWSINPLNIGIKKIIFLSVLIVLLRPIFSATRNSKIDSLLGELSYPIYISHLLAYTIAKTLVRTNIVNELALLITCMASLTLVRVIDRPIDLWRSRVFRG